MSEKGRVAGIDYGTVRIGVAISDPDRMIASPCENYIRKNETHDAKFFRNFVEREHVVQFVVGFPVHLDGRLSEKARESLQFGKWLNEITGIPVDYYDERYTSVEAERLMIDADMSRKKRKQRLDKVAAQILLSGYLESGCQGTLHPPALDE